MTYIGSDLLIGKAAPIYPPEQIFNTSMPWYSMTAAYFWGRSGPKIQKYERRITFCRADDQCEAERRFLVEAEQYQDEETVMLDKYWIYEVYGEPGREPIEVASEMTIGIDAASGQLIEPEDFAKCCFGAARLVSCETLGLPHSWYRRDNHTSGCYNCEEVRKGGPDQNDKQSDSSRV